MTRSPAAGLLACLLLAAPAAAHELWFQPAGPGAEAVRLTFGDTPAPGEAERVAEIAHAVVWGDGRPLEVRRLDDGLEAVLPDPRPAVLSAYADRGVIDYEGDTFVIELAAYDQSRPVASIADAPLGVDDDQLRLLLVERGGRPPIIRALWRGEPAADVLVRTFHGPDGAPTESLTDDRGELPCPDLSDGPVLLLAVFFDETPGRRDGRSYSHTRFKATLTLTPGAEE